MPTSRIGRADSLVERIAGRYGTRWNRNYVRGKLHFDPVYTAAATALADQTLPLLDLGCGIGLFAFYLKESGFRPSIVGVDFDEAKIDTARMIASAWYPDTTFAALNLELGFPGHSGCVSCLDILQYFSPERQSALLQEAAAAVAPGGVLILRTGIRDASWRHKITIWGDRFTRLIRWMKSPLVRFPSKEEILAILTKHGLAGSIKPLWGRTPFNNYLCVFRRLESTGSAREQESPPGE